MTKAARLVPPHHCRCGRRIGSGGTGPCARPGTRPVRWTGSTGAENHRDLVDVRELRLPRQVVTADNREDVVDVREAVADLRPDVHPDGRPEVSRPDEDRVSAPVLRDP